jgi:hypothetical protein
MVRLQNFANIEEMNFDTGAQDPLVGRPRVAKRLSANAVERFDEQN